MDDGPPPTASDARRSPPPPPEMYEMAFTTGDLPRLRRLTADWARRAGMSAAGFHDFVIAVNEIATNAVRHGSPRAWLRLRATANALFAEIRDTGRWPAGGPSRSGPPECGGMGLKVVRMVCDDVQVNPGCDGTVVRLRMAVR